jgi:transposase InsO family protein
VGQSLKGEDVVAVMQRLHQQLGVVLERIQVDNGSEFISKALDRWAYDQHVTLDFSRPGKPTANPYIESFNGSFLGRVPERALVFIVDRCTGENRALAPGIQWLSAPQFVTEFNAR